MRAVAFAICSVMTFLAACSRQPDAPHIRPSEQALVNHALDIYSKGKVSRAELLKTYDPVVVYLPKMTCVGLNLRPGIAGGDTTMCFDRSNKFLGYYVNGD
jgi:hypothetical protein